MFDALYPSTGSGYALFQATPPGTFTTVTGSSLLNLVLPGSSTAVIGASMSASPNPGFDMLHLLGTGPTSFQEVIYQVSSTSVVFLSAPRGSIPLPFIPAGITRVMYFYDDNAAADNRSFASWYDTSSSSWVTYAWWQSPVGVGSIFSMRLPMDHRPDALLSTGQLLSTEEGTGRLYDRNGNLLSTFALGNLVYIAEEYVNGVPRCYFSQCLIYDRWLHFNIYWIQTSQLGTLGN